VFFLTLQEVKSASNMSHAVRFAFAKPLHVFLRKHFRLRKEKVFKYL